MQFSVVALFSLVALVAASPAQMSRGMTKRQAGGDVPIGEGAMTNQAGDVIPFNTAGVYLDSKAKGL